ncbi:MAG: hypothetical protein R2867_13720 [Caldilineaceae bacterium]
MATTIAVRPQRKRRRKRTRDTINGILFAAPWLLGLAMFWIYPTFASGYYSFTTFNAVQTPTWVGLSNYQTLFTADPVFATRSITRSSLPSFLFPWRLSLPLAWR